MYKYNKTDKVNVYSYGCSDGSEPYTFLMSIISTYGLENAKKFLPIKAFDYDSVAIEKAQKGIYSVKSYEDNAIAKLTNCRESQFFSRFEEGKEITLMPKKILTENVDFKVANILNDYKNINSQNSIVFARNFWPYLKENAAILAKRLGKQMKENSTLILGEYDIQGSEWNGIDIVKLLVNNGFKVSKDVDFVFEK